MYSRPQPKQSATPEDRGERRGLSFIKEARRGNPFGRFPTPQKENGSVQRQEIATEPKLGVTSSPEAIALTAKLAKLIQDGQLGAPGPNAPVDHRLAATISITVKQLISKNKMPKGESAGTSLEPS